MSGCCRSLDLERQVLYYLFLYPEKYWKQINFYYNANKAWVPAKMRGEDQKLEAQQKMREKFIRFFPSWEFSEPKIPYDPVESWILPISNASIEKNPVFDSVRAWSVRVLKYVYPGA